MKKKPFGQVTTKGGWVGIPAKKNIDVAKKGKRRLVIHPIFVECGEYFESVDIFWSKIFIAMGVGKFPKSFAFKSGSIVFNKNNKPIIEEINLNRSLRSITKNIMNFYKKHGNIYSDLDKKKINEIYEKERLKEIPDLTWGGCGKKNRENLINKFSEELTELLELNQEETRQLLFIIRTGILLKQFDKTNIILLDNKIDKIEGLLWSAKNRIFTLDKNLEKKSKEQNNFDDDDENYKLERYISKPLKLEKPSFITDFSSILEAISKKEVKPVKPKKKKPIVVSDE